MYNRKYNSTQTITKVPTSLWKKKSSGKLDSRNEEERHTPSAIWHKAWKKTMGEKDGCVK